MCWGIGIWFRWVGLGAVGLTVIVGVLASGTLKKVTDCHKPNALIGDDGWCGETQTLAGSTLKDWFPKLPT